MVDRLLVTHRHGDQRLAVVCAAGDGYLVLIHGTSELQWISVLELSEWTAVNAQPSITCPVCHRTSYNLNDIREKYCGFCHKFNDEH